MTAGRINKAECRALRAQGWTLDQLRARYGVSRPAVSVACRGVVCSINRRSNGARALAEQRRQERDERRAHALQLRDQGLSPFEIGLRLGVTRSAVFSYLRGWDQSRPLEIPGWVPTPLRETYRAIGTARGEEAAASAIRRLKSQAAAQCR